MIKVSIAAIKKQSQNRPAGYIEDVFENAESKNETHVFLTREKYYELKAKYNPETNFLAAVEACEHRGEITRQVTCKLCGGREKQVPIYHCDRFETECTIDHYQSGQAERVCKRCEIFN